MCRAPAVGQPLNHRGAAAGCTWGSQPQAAAGCTVARPPVQLRSKEQPGPWSCLKHSCIDALARAPACMLAPFLARSPPCVHPATLQAQSAFQLAVAMSIMIGSVFVAKAAWDEDKAIYVRAGHTVRQWPCWGAKGISPRQLHRVRHASHRVRCLRLALAEHTSQQWPFWGATGVCS